MRSMCLTVDAYKQVVLLRESQSARKGRGLKLFKKFLEGRVVRYLKMFIACY